MTENNILSLLSNIIEQDNTNIKNNKVFSMISLAVLQEITDIYQKDSNQPLLSNNNTGENKELSNMIGQLQQNDSNELQKMLPLLLGTLNGNNNLNNLMNMIKNSVDNNNEKNNMNKNNKNKENNSEQKKNLDWSRLRL